jgi:hypothetical protein
LRPDRDVRVAPEASLLHVAVRDAAIFQYALQGREELVRLLGRAEVRIGHDLDQGRAGAIEVDPRVARLVDVLGGMEEFARVLLHMNPGQADAAAVSERDAAARGERQIELRDLVGLREIRVEVVLAVELHPGRDRTLERERGERREFHGTSVQDRQGPGQGKAGRADIGIRRVAKAIRAGAEDLGAGQELDVDLQTDDGLECGAHAENSSGWRSCQSVRR